MALLAYLVVEGRSQTREELAGLLWGESPEAEARASLRQALKHLRERVGELLAPGRQWIELAQPIDCDVPQFRAAIHADPRRASTFDVPRFLSGFSVRHAPRFEEWATETRRTLLRQYEQVLGELARTALAHGRWREATELGDRWLACDPLSDEAARATIEARYLSGDRGAALTRFHEYRATLRREAGCEPSRSLLALVHRVESDTSTSAARPAVTDEWPVNAPTFESSLFGRDAEWSALSRCWKSARRGTGSVVLVEGDPGIGKSRLTSDYVRWVVADGGIVLRGRSGDSRAGFPFASAVEVLRDMLTAPGLGGTAPEWLAETARLLPEIRQRFPALPEPAADETDGSRLSEGVTQVLMSLAAESPILVLLENLQWFDAESCNLLRYVIRHLEGSPVLWVVTVTLGELEREAPSARLLRVLRAKSSVQVLTLSPLAEAQVTSMIAEMTPASEAGLAQRLGGRVYEATSGNPFYVLELLKTLFSQGLLTTDANSGAWLAAPALERQGFELPTSQSINDVVAERVERLPDRLRDALFTIAVSETGCGASVLSHVHGISRLYAASIGDALVDRRLVVEQGGVYRCAHRMIEQGVRERLTESRRRELHRALAEAMELATPPHDLPSAAAGIARHADLAGDSVRAYRHALVASEDARRRYAFGEALAWLDLAASSAQPGGETETVDRLTAQLIELAGDTDQARTAAAPGSPSVVT
ncbi:MAG TPA: AAA family ATPase [Gemmatimonadales bacterium]|nr:AAA family ATPase [Gemmatimonadales bacterium]